MTRSAKTPFIALGFALGTLAAAPAHAQDSDGDGAANINDAYPCDASIAAVSFAPAEGQHAALLFEDQWPQLGDADFNDAVITYNYVVRENAAGQAVAITATFNALALGGVFDNGLGLHLPIPAANVAGVTLTQGTGSPQPLTVSGVDTELTVQVINNLRTLFGGQAGVINAIDGATISSEALQVDITLSTPIALDLSVAPFDVYLFRSTTPAHEIHRNGYTGTAAMDTTLFNTDSDASRPGLSFVDVRGLPFVLHIPQFNVYAKEATDIAQLWPRIMSFVASGGVQDQDFYSGDAVLANAFAGSVSPTPSLNAAAPVADFSCIVRTTPSGISGAVAEWLLDGNGWDAVGSNDLDATSATFVTDPERGQVMRTVSNAASDVSIPSATLGITGSSARTMAGWVRIENYNDSFQYPIFGWHPQGPARNYGDGFMLALQRSSYRAADPLRFTVWSHWGGFLLQGNPQADPLIDGGWHHVAIATNGSNHVAYVDGVELYRGGANGGTGQPTNTSSIDAVVLGLGLRRNSGPTVAGRYSDNNMVMYLDNVAVFNRVLSSTEVAILSNDGISSATTDVFGDASAIALYRFEGDVTDAAGNLNGTNIGTPGFTTGRFGQAVSYTGTARSVINGLTPAYFRTNVRSVSAWVYLDGSSGTDYWMGNAIPFQTTDCWYLLGTSTYLRSNLRQNNADTSILTQTGLTAGWHHIVSTFTGFSGGTHNFYVDGILFGSKSTGTVTFANAVNFHIGSVGSNTPSGSRVIDQVRLFNRVLSPAEVGILFNEK